MNIFEYQCQHIEALTPDISAFTFIPVKVPLNYQSGQYVLTTIKAGAQLPLSIANAPTKEGILTFQVRHDEHHSLARQWQREMSVGHTIMLQGPFGKCTLSNAPTSQWLFLAGGTGFAPIKALLETALFDLKNTSALKLYWGIKNPQDAYALPLLTTWQQQFPQFEYTLILSMPEQFPAWQGPVGYAHEYLAEELQDLSSYSVFASGPFPMIQAAAQLFMQHGLLPKHLLSDMIKW